jgi:hypothetical protein
MTIYVPALNKYRIVKRFSSLYNDVHKEAFPEWRIKNGRIKRILSEGKVKRFNYREVKKWRTL